MNIVVYGLIPYILMSVSNIMLVYTLICKKKNISSDISEESNLKRKSLCYTVIILTIMFIVLSFPDNMLNAFFIAPLLENNYGYVVLFTIDNLAFSYHAFHFAILLLTNKRFLQEVKTILRLVSSNKVRNTEVYPRKVLSKKVATAITESKIILH